MMMIQGALSVKVHKLGKKDSRFKEEQEQEIKIINIFKEPM